MEQRHSSIRGGGDGDRSRGCACSTTMVVPVLVQVPLRAAEAIPVAEEGAAAEQP